MNRRLFLRQGAFTLVGTAAIPSFLVRSVFAEASHAKASNKRLVVIFQRGAADGLNIVVPWREPNYYAMRPTIAIPEKQVLDLDGVFGLHPSMAAFEPLYRQGHLAIVHAAGSPDPTRSHFEAQDTMESGTPGMNIASDGWLNRALQAEDERQPHTSSTFRALALGSDIPRTLSGRVPALALANINGFGVASQGSKPSSVANTMERMYNASGDHIFHVAGQETFDAIGMLRAASTAPYKPAPGVEYQGPFGNNMRQIAQLLKANIGVETAFTDMGGWDTHLNQGGVNGPLANRLKEFSNAIAAFWRDMGDDAADITLVTMSEFGRTAAQNGTGGTDHGHGNVMFVLGGGVKGGKVYGRWPGLAKEQLNEQRDLAVTTDFRQVLGEAITGAMGPLDLKRVFPGADLHAWTPLGLTKS